MIEAFSEQLITIDELRARMPHLRAREANLRRQIDALDAQAADQHAYLKLAEDLEGFLTRLHTNAATATVQDRQRVLRLLVKDILIDPEKITIRHRIPTHASTSRHDTDSDTEGDHRPGYPLRWGREDPALRSAGDAAFPGAGGCEDPGLQEGFHQRQNALVGDPCPEPVHQGGVIDVVEEGERCADGSHVHCCSVDGRGARLCPLRSRRGYAAGLHHDLPGPTHLPSRQFPAPGHRLDDGSRPGCAPHSRPNPPGSSGSTIKRLYDTGSSRAPSRLAHQARPVR